MQKLISKNIPWVQGKQLSIQYAIVDFGKYTMGKQLSIQYAKVDFGKYTMGK